MDTLSKNQTIYSSFPLLGFRDHNLEFEPPVDVEGRAECPLLRNLALPVSTDSVPHSSCAATAFTKLFVPLSAATHWPLSMITVEIGGPPQSGLSNRTAVQGVPSRMPLTLLTPPVVPRDWHPPEAVSRTFCILLPQALSLKLSNWRSPSDVVGALHARIPALSKPMIVSSQSLC
jgi:hypothetical protein